MPSVIINNIQEVFVFSLYGLLVWIPDVNMNEVKRSKSMRLTKGKREFSELGKKAHVRASLILAIGAYSNYDAMDLGDH